MAPAPNRLAMDQVLLLEQRRRAHQRARWFHFSLILSLAAGLLAYAPTGFIGSGDRDWWWPFGGSAEAPQQETVDIAIGDGTADMEAVYVSIPQYNNAESTLSGIRVIAFGNMGTYEDMCFENQLGRAEVYYGSNC